MIIREKAHQKRLADESIEDAKENFYAYIEVNIVLISMYGIVFLWGVIGKLMECNWSFLGIPK